MRDKIDISQCALLNMTVKAITAPQGSILEKKKPFSQLAPEFLDLVASTNFLVPKNFPRKLLLEKSAVQTVNTAFSSARRKLKDEKP